MRFTELPIQGAYLVDVDRIGDDRGFFGRLWCQRELEDMGLNGTIVQSNVGISVKAGTTRGLHFQTAPHSEVKFVRCSRGVMYDVIVDLRKDSPTFKKWFGIELTAENCRMLYVPEGCATGYQTLVDNTEMYYHTTAFYAPDFATGVRHDDPAFGIEWPLPVSVMSDNDKNWPDFSDQEALKKT
jgi:dTDP-4-dehydrorhamnose 3,5-epimerase